MVMSRKKYVVGGIIIWSLFFVQFGLFAQRTLIDSDPLKEYNDANELYEYEKYGAALEMFSSFIEDVPEYLLTAQSEYLMAVCAQELGMKNTEDLFNYFIEKYPEQNKALAIYLKLAKYNFDNKNYDKALNWLLKVPSPKLLDVPEAQDYQFMLGYSLYKQKKYDQALIALSDLDENKNPYYNYANYYKGSIYYIQDKYQDALNKFLKIKDDEKFKTIVPPYIVQLYFNLGNYRQTIDFGNTALLIPKVAKPDDMKYHIAMSYFKTANYSRASLAYKALVDINYNLNDNDLYCYGFSLYNEQSYQDAGRILSQITIKEDTIGQNISYLLGTIYLQLKEKLKARNLFLFASNLSFDANTAGMAKVNYAKLSYELNFIKEAINALQEFIKKYPGSDQADEAKSLLGDILLNTANYKDAIEILESIPDKNDRMKKTYQEIAYFYALEFFQNKNYDEAIKGFAKVIQNPVDNKYTSQANFWTGESNYQKKEYSQALELYRNFITFPEAKKTPYYAVAYYNMAYCFLKDQKYTEAKENFQQYTQLEENNKHTDRYFDGIIRLADCYMVLKTYDEALKYYNQIIVYGQQETDYALYQKAIILGLQNNNEEKLATLVILKDKYPSSTYADDAGYEIANIYFLETKYAMALEKFTSFSVNYSRSPYAIASNLKIGLCNYNLGNDDVALEQLKEIITKYPYSAEAKEATNVVKNIYVDKGQADKLFDFFNTIPKINLTKSFQDSTFYNSAFSFIKKNNCEEAIKALQNYLAQYPNGYFAVNANYYLASCSYTLSNKEKSLQYYEVVNNWSPNEFTEKSLIASSDLLFKTQSYENAANRYKQLEEVSTNKENQLNAMLGQLRCYYLLNRFEQCIVYADKIINTAYASDNNKIEAEYYKGKSNFDLNKYDLALTSLATVVDKTKSAWGAEAEYLIASIYYQKEDYTKSLNEIVSLKDNYPDYDFWVAKGFLLLSDVFIKIGDLFQAKSTVESIISNYEGEDLLIIAKQKLQNIIELQKQNEQKEQQKDEQNDQKQKLDNE
jgi:TolA-binding protein